MLTVLWPTFLILGLFLLLPALARILGSSNLSPPQGNWRALVFAPLFLLQLHYVYWRLTDTVPELSMSVQGLWPLVFLLFEMSTMLSMVMIYVTLSRRSDRTAEVDAHLGILKGTAYKVALFIPTYNEPANVLENTILGALLQRYPGVRVFVLDDSRRDWLRELCAKAGVDYCRRDNNRGAKAGNLNAGLATARARGFDPDFIGVLDADFVARPDFIERCLVLHLLHPEAGIVQSPQHFFNPDPVQMNLVLTGAAPDEQRFFFDELMPAKDAWGTVFCCGTSSLIRTRALQGIGGFPTESVTEDMLMSLRMREHGWRTLYLNEVLTTGLSPEGCGEYLKQRHRWCLGFMQIFRDHYNPFSPRHRLGLMDRLHLLDSFQYWAVSFPARYIYLLAPAIYWVTGWQVIDTTLDQVLLHLLPWLVAHVLAMAWVTRGALQPILNDITQLLVARASMHATFTGLFSRKEHKFVVTPKGELGDRAHVEWRALSPILVLIGINLGGVLISLFPELQQNLPFEPRVLNLFWLVVNTTILALTALACIDLPRRRRHERMRLPQPLAATLHMGNDDIPVHILDLSSSGCRLRLEHGQELFNVPLPQPAILRLDEEEQYMLQLMRRSGTNELGCQFCEMPLPQRLRLTERIFSDTPANLGYQTSSTRLMGHLLRNLWSQRGHR